MRGGDSDLFFAVLPVAEARARLFSHYQPSPLAREEVELGQALGRVTAEAVLATEDVPPFARSTVDGFALRAADTFGASEGLPAFLALGEDIPMGKAAERKIAPGQGARIATGGMLPPGADAVVMVEYSEPIDEKTVAVLGPVAPGENVIRRGEDIAAHSHLLPAGHTLRPADIGALAALGRTRVWCGGHQGGDYIHRDEIVPRRWSRPRQPDINSYSLWAAVTAAGENRYIWACRDETAAVRQGLSWPQGLRSCSLSGSSVAPGMWLPVLTELGPPGVLVHGVACGGQAPLIALAGQTGLCLPGHPVSVLHLRSFVRPTSSSWADRYPGQIGPVKAEPILGSGAGGTYTGPAEEGKDGLWAQPVRENQANYRPLAARE